MVKTEQGSRRTGRKRGRRGGFRNPAFRAMVRNGEISPSAELTPISSMRQSLSGEIEGKTEYLRLHYAQMETLLNYFDEEWFDFDSLISDEMKTAYSDRTKSKNSIFRCDFCVRPWSIGRNYSEAEYYDINTFLNIPMEKRTYLECESVLPAGIE